MAETSVFSSMILMPSSETLIVIRCLWSPIVRTAAFSFAIATCESNSSLQIYATTLTSRDTCNVTWSASTTDNAFPDTRVVLSSGPTMWQVKCEPWKSWRCAMGQLMVGHGAVDCWPRNSWRSVMDSQLLAIEQLTADHEAVNCWQWDSWQLPWDSFGHIFGHVTQHLLKAKRTKTVTTYRN